ncbi:MAG TPA: amidase [Baekduia sp.]|jgi:Asp-tRNA(Asn)/Glu-tRNA(Gln) amidotransferase A subunit family amidase|nr:amidase [Baekduia sp.]
MEAIPQDLSSRGARAAVAASVSRGEVSPRELVAEALARIEALDGPLNAVVALRAEEALAEASRAPRTGALAGLPLLVKDLASCAGMVTTYGSPWFADRAPDVVDDAAVARLRAAGAIVVGRTNVPAFGHTAFTTNLVFGTTRSPWNLERSPGGSSGGSAAALAAGMVPLATTSDGGGSVRGPASLSGLVGYKPTNGAIGRNVIPRWMDFSTMGCAGPSVADVLLEASVVVGPVPGDLLAVESVDLVPALPRRVIACPSLRGPGAVDAPIADGFEDACALVADTLGLPLEVVDEPVDPLTALWWAMIACVQLAESLTELRDRWDEAEPSLKLQLDIGAQVGAFDYVAAERQRFAQCARLDALLGDDTVLLTPTANATSWPAEGPLPDHAGDRVGDPLVALNCADLNMTGHPAVSVPWGRDPDGMPFGMQLIAPRRRDGLALGLAHAIELAHPWPLTAPGFRPFTP